MKGLVSINGKVYAPEEAKISVYDRGFLFGDAVYEVTRSYGRVFFALEDHLDRLFHSARGIDLELEKTKEEFIEDFYKLFKQVEEENIYIRLQISRGEVAKEQISLDPKNTTAPNMIMYLHKLKKYPKELFENGIDLVTTEYLRNSKRALDPNIKSGNYLNNIMGFMKANKSQAMDTIFLNKEGNVTEGTTFNVFMVKDGVILTSPHDYDILQGITRKIVLKLIEENGLKLELRGFSVEEMMEADEAFITSSTKEVLAVRNLNGRSIKTVNGSVTKQLAQAYKQFVIDYCTWAKDNHPWK